MCEKAHARLRGPKLEMYSVTERPIPSLEAPCQLRGSRSVSGCEDPGNHASSIAGLTDQQAALCCMRRLRSVSLVMLVAKYKILVGSGRIGVGKSGPAKRGSYNGTT